jgi:hypothetical protein
MRVERGVEPRSPAAALPRSALVRPAIYELSVRSGSDVTSPGAPSNEMVSAIPVRFHVA